MGTLALGHVAMLAARRDPAALLAHSAVLKKRFKTVRSRPAAVQARRRDVCTNFSARQSRVNIKVRIQMQALGLSTLNPMTLQAHQGVTSPRPQCFGHWCARTSGVNQAVRPGIEIRATLTPITSSCCHEDAVSAEPRLHVLLSGSALLQHCRQQGKTGS